MPRRAPASRGPCSRRRRSGRSCRCTCRRRPRCCVAMTASAPSICPIGSTTSVPDADTMMTSRPARWCSSMRLTASSYTSGSTMLCRVSATISRTDCTGHPVHIWERNCAHLLHLVVVGAADEVHELRVGAAQHRPPADQAAGVELLAEGERARLGDDRLVEVEERSRPPGACGAYARRGALGVVSTSAHGPKCAGCPEVAQRHPPDRRVDPSCCFHSPRASVAWFLRGKVKKPLLLVRLRISRRTHVFSGSQCPRKSPAAPPAAG